jgi:hypothetical protein
MPEDETYELPVKVTIPSEKVHIVASLAAVQYIGEDGKVGYAFSTQGEAPMTTYLGLLAAGAGHVYRWGGESGHG